MVFIEAPLSSPSCDHNSSPPQTFRVSPQGSMPNPTATPLDLYSEKTGSEHDVLISYKYENEKGTDNSDTMGGGHDSDSDDM